MVVVSENATNIEPSLLVIEQPFAKEAVNKGSFDMTAPCYHSENRLSV
jgi:hypothetical protein